MYRTDLFEEAGYDSCPSTYEELYEAAGKIKQIILKWIH